MNEAEKGGSPYRGMSRISTRERAPGPMVGILGEHAMSDLRRLVS